MESLLVAGTIIGIIVFVVVFLTLVETYSNFFAFVLNAGLIVFGAWLFYTGIEINNVVGGILCVIAVGCLLIGGANVYFISREKR